MSGFFVNTQDGRVATQNQLQEAGFLDERFHPLKPWHPIQGPSDASTMWYAVMRKQERGVYIGALCFRHGPRQASMEEAGWAEVEVGAIGVDQSPVASRQEKR